MNGYDKALQSRMAATGYQPAFRENDRLGRCSSDCPKLQNGVCFVTMEKAAPICEPWARDVALLAERAANQFWNAAYCSAFSLSVYNYVQHEGRLPPRDAEGQYVYDSAGRLAEEVANRAFETRSSEP